MSADLKIFSAPPIVAPTARAYNRMVDLLQCISGSGGIDVTISDNNIQISIDGTALAETISAFIAANTGGLSDQIADIAIDAVADGYCDAYINGLITTALSGLTASDISDFDSAAVAAVLPITSGDVTDFDSAAAAAVLPITSGDVSDFDSAAADAAPVQSVAGRTGDVTLSTSDISGYAGGVTSVAGRTGAVSLAWADLSDAEVRANTAAANYVANYTDENVYTVCANGSPANVTFIVRA